MTTPLPFDERGAWRRYTTADGLAANQTEHIVEDSDGYLWIATVTGGVSRFDGDEFRTYTTRDGLPSDTVYFLLVDRDGQVWCGTYGGLCLFDGEGFHPFEGDSRVANDGIKYLFEDSHGRVWLKGVHVCGFWDGQRYCDLAPRVQALTGSRYGVACWGICEDETGAIWLAGRHHPVRWCEGTVEQITVPTDLPVYTCCLAAHPEGGVWHSVEGRIGVWREGRYEAIDVTVNGRVRKILTDRQRRTWFCMLGAALVYENGRFRRVGAQEIGHELVVGFHEDREGNLWFATMGGLTRFDPAGPFALGEAEGLPSHQAARVAEDSEQRLWVQFANMFLMDDVAGYLDGGCFRAVPETAGHGGGLVATSEGSLWVAGTGGLARWRDGGIETVLARKSAESVALHEKPRVTCLAQDGQGRFLLGWHLGWRWSQPMRLAVSRYDGTSEQDLFEMEAPDRYSSILALTPSPGGLWFGVGALSGQGPGHGLGFLDHSGKVTWYLPTDGLVHPNVEALHVDHAGHLWIATLGGISRFDGRGFANFTTADGLPHNHVRSIAEDEDGGLWFGTDAGVARFDSAAGAFQLLRFGAGSPIRSMTRDHTGQWWFATMEGLVGYRPSSVPPRVRVLQTLADRIYRGAESVDVSTSVRQLVFEFKGMSFRTAAADMLYRCRLLGHEEDWRPASRERRAFYRDLPPGDYTFQVVAVDRDLNVSEPAEVPVTVRRSARDARIEELEAHVAERTRELADRNRALEEANRQQEALNRQLAEASRKVQEANRLKTEFLARMSHDLRTPMNAIIGYARLLLRRTKGVLDERQYRNLENIQTSAHNLLDLINDILDLSKIEAGRVEVHPKDMDPATLVRECCAAVEPLVKPGVELRQQVAFEGTLRTDPDRLRRALMNLLGNALKFTEAGHVTVSLAGRDGAAELSVADTGIGIPAAELPHIFDEFRQVARKGSTAQEGTGLGLAIVKRSAELIGGSVTVASAEGVGTTFALRIPSLSATPSPSGDRS